MFGLFKRKMAPEGPVEFKTEMRIERAVADVYPLLDFSDERNAKRAEGNTILPGDGADSWRLLMRGLEGHEFLLDLIQAQPPVRYEYESRTVPIIGRLVSAIECWSLEPVGEDACSLRLVVTAEFVSGLTEKQFANEVTMMTVACHNAVARLKIHAEHGPDAARDAESISVESTRASG